MTMMSLTQNEQPVPDGSPDLYFRGFYCWNSEVGSKTLGIAAFYLRAVCMKSLGCRELRANHHPACQVCRTTFRARSGTSADEFRDSSPAPFIAGIKAARERIVARTGEERESFLRKRGFSKSATAKIIETVLHEEGGPPESVFDFVQGITALARGKVHQDARLELEGRARRLLERVI
jgi:hypothetical protein